MPASKRLARAAWFAGLCLWCAFSAAQMPLDKALGTARFPTPHDLRLELAPPLSLEQALSRAKFPGPSDLRVTLQPPISLDQALANARFPAPADLALTLEPPAGAAPAVLGQALPAAAATPSLAPLGSATPPPPPNPGAASVAMPNPEALAAIGTATLPIPQPLSVTLVPPATPLSEVAKATLPAPQPLSVTLVPPVTPLAAIGVAKFPDAAPLSVTLYAGEPLVAATMLAAMVSPLALGPGQYTVQIVQVIPRRGAQFFDYRDPTGAATVLVAGGGAPAPGGAPPAGPLCVPPATPPLGAEQCGTTLSLSDDGFPFGANLGPQGNRSMHLTPVGGAQIQIAAQTGITPNAACPGLLCTTTQVFTPGAACDNVSFVDTGTPKAPIVRFRRNGGQVCAQRLQ